MTQPQREVALDTETTGLEPDDGHRIVEIGCVEMINGVRTGNTYHIYLNPERDMPSEAQRVHGLSGDFLRDKPLFKDILKPFLGFIADSRLIIHNAPFDMKFLNAEILNAKHPPLPMERALDTVAMAKRMFPGSPASLDALCKRFSIDLSKRKYHGALLDAELLADVYLELIGGKQNNLWAEDRAAMADAAAMTYVSAENYSDIINAILPVPPTADEQAAHEQFLKGVKNAIWANYSGN
jgi:DNA polymerase-3 subunit epsilon